VLVTLDQNVKLETPLADLAVHEPDHKLLIAFLKQMEFSTLTRRVAEFAHIDSGGIDPSSAAVPKTLPNTDRPASAGAAAPASPGLPLTGGGMTLKPRPGAPEPAVAMAPEQLAATRLDAARTSKIERARYEIVRSIDRLQAWNHTAPSIWDRCDQHRDARHRSDAGAALRHCAGGRAKTRPCYIPLAHRKGAWRRRCRWPVRRRPRSGPRFPEGGAPAAQALPRGARRPEDRTT